MKHPAGTSTMVTPLKSWDTGIQTVLEAPAGIKVGAGDEIRVGVRVHVIVAVGVSVWVWVALAVAVKV